MFEVKRLTNKRQYLGFVVNLPKNSKFSTSASKSLNGQ